MHKFRKNIISIILIFWSIINFLMFSLVYIGWGEVTPYFVISGYKLMFTFNKESFITILAVTQIVYTLVILGMFVLGILFLVNKNNIKQNSSIIYYAKLFRLLPFLVITLNIIIIVTMVIGIKVSESCQDCIYLFHWFIGPGVNLNFIINFIVSIIFLFFSKRLMKHMYNLKKECDAKK